MVNFGLDLLNYQWGANSPTSMADLPLGIRAGIWFVLWIIFWIFWVGNLLVRSWPEVRFAKIYED